VVPSLRRLFQAIEGLVERAHQLTMGKLNEVSGLGAIDYFCKHVMKECVLDVEQVHRPTPEDGQSEHNLNGGRLDDWVEDLVVVHPEALSESLENLTSLVSVQRAICLELVLKDPLVRHHVGPRRSGDQVSRVVGHQGLVLLLHSASPIGGSVSALRTEVRTGDNVGGAMTTESCRWLMGLVTTTERSVTIGWVLRES
jgi:hypothetical protein